MTQWPSSSDDNGGIGTPPSLLAYYTVFIYLLLSVHRSTPYLINYYKSYGRLAYPTADHDTTPSNTTNTTKHHDERTTPNKTRWIQVPTHQGATNTNPHQKKPLWRPPDRKTHKNRFTLQANAPILQILLLLVPLFLYQDPVTMHSSQSKSSLSSAAARSAAAIAAASSQGINRQKSIIREEVGEAKSANAYKLNRTKVVIPKVTNSNKPNKPKRKAEKEDTDDTKRRRDKADDDMVVEKVIDLLSDKMETDEEDNEDEDEEEESYANFFERNKKEQEDKEQEESESDSAAFSDDEEAKIFDEEGDEVDATGKKVKKSGYMSVDWTSD